MKKIILISLSLLTMFVAKAQTEQGNLLLGANLANIRIGLDNNGSSFGISPSVGYFVMENIAIGASLPINFSGYSNSASSSTSNSFGLGAYGRYYIPMDKVSVFAGAGFGFARYSSRSSYLDFSGNKITNKNSDSNPFANLNGGLVYFLNSNIGLEGTLNIGDLLNPGTSLSLNLGLQIYFNNNKEN